MSTTHDEATVVEGASIVGPLVGGAVIGLAVAAAVGALLGSGRRGQRAVREAAAIRRDLRGLADEAVALAESAQPRPRPAPPAYPDERLGNLGRGLLLGLAVGAWVGLNRAPRAGAATRATVQKWVDDAKTEARAIVSDFGGWAATSAATAESPPPPAQ